MAFRCMMGAETNSVAAEWPSTAGSAFTIQSTVKRTGNYAYQVSGLSSGTRSGVFYGGLPNVFYVCAYLYLDTLPSAENTIGFLGSSISSANYRLKLTSTGTLKIYNADGTTVMGTSSALSTGQWYRVEFGISSASTFDTVVGQLDGTSFCNSATGNAGTTSGFFLGGNGNAEAQTVLKFYCDDVTVSDSGFPGAGGVLTLFPNAAGDAATGSASGSSPAATGWQSVQASNDGVDYWVLATQSGSATAADRLCVNLDNIPSGLTFTSIQVVQANVRMKPASNASCSYAIQLLSSSGGTINEATATAVTGTAWVTNDDATSHDPKITRTTDPDGSTWTQSLINSSQIGIRGTDTTPNVWVECLWLNVRADWTASGGTTWTQSLSETLSLTDSRTLLVGKNLSDSLALSDTRSALVGKNVSEVLSLTDARRATFSKSLTELLSLSDSLSKLLNHFQTVTESLALSDTLTKTANKGLTESLSLSDLRVMSVVKNLTESLNLTDTRALGIIKAAFTETLNLTDTLSKNPNKGLSESVNLTDSLLKATTKALTELLGLSDTRSLTAGKNVSENLTGSLSDALSKNTNKALAETLNLNDALTKGLTKNLSETVTLTDFFNSGLFLLLTESLNLTDNRVFNVVKSLNESLSLSDARSLAVVKTLSESFGLTDTLSKETLKRLTEALTLADGLINQWIPGGGGDHLLMSLAEELLLYDNTALTRVLKLIHTSQTLKEEILKQTQKSGSMGVTVSDGSEDISVSEN